MADDTRDQGDARRLSPEERAHLRRMMLDDEFARRFKIQVKAWVVLLGTVAAIIIAVKTLLWEFVSKHLH